MNPKEMACSVACLGLLLGGLGVQAGTASQAAQTAPKNFVSYTGAAWGPDGDTIYCIKLLLNSQTGRQYWLCTMKWDGSEKQEICELWAGQGAFVDTQSGPVWMEVNAATSNIAFSVECGNAVSVGLWIVGLDGKNQRRPFPLVWNAQEKWAPLHPSWSPDGTNIVFEEEDRTTPESSITRLVLYDLQRKERRQLTDGPRDQHPVWSPKGDWIAYTHYLRYDNAYADRRIWLIRPDGSEQKPVVDEKGKPINGWWPSWNPGGTKVSFDSDSVLRVASPDKGSIQKIDPLYIMGVRSPWLLMGHHWGKRGWLWIGRHLTFVDATTYKAWMIEGAAPVELHGQE